MRDARTPPDSIPTTRATYSLTAVRPAVYYEPQFEPGRLNTLLEGILTRDIVFAPHRDILYAHKRIGGRDVYFVTNDTDRAQSVKLSFPGARKLELWNHQRRLVGEG